MENICLFLIILFMIGITAAALFGLLFFRRKYFRIYEETQKMQRSILENNPVSKVSLKEDPVSLIQDGFLKIQHKYQKEERELQQEKNAVKNLISHLSHQLKTPLSNIRLYQDLLKSPNLPQEKKKNLEDMLDLQTDKLEWLLDSLFKMTDLERSTTFFSLQTGSVRPVLIHAIDAVRPRAEKKRIQITFRSCTLSPVLFHPEWTEEVFSNLLENAVKYSPEDTNITISCEDFETYCEIRIKDQGWGIPSDEQCLIFQKFYRGSLTSEEEGWGIGLYLSRLILSKEKGHITVCSEPGSGSIFSVFLPLSNSSNYDNTVRKNSVPCKENVRSS